MVRVKLNLLNIFALKLDKNSIEYEGKTVGNIISKFIKEYKDQLDDGLLNSTKKKLHKDILILINGRNIQYLKKYRTELKDGDEVYLSVALAGG
jgi:molybdopterin converting factor small subunit